MLSRLTHPRRLLVLLVLGVVAALPATASAGAFPDTIRLPDGWQPEGIAAGRGTSLYVGSIPTGAVWKGDARTGQGDVLVPGRPGERSAIGIKVDRRNRLFVAGGATGQAFVYDAGTGADLASYQLAPAGAATFVNDVVVTAKGAFFTDSTNQQLYVVPFGRHGRLPGQDAVRTLPLTGDLVYQDEDGNYYVVDRTKDAIETAEGTGYSVLMEEMLLSEISAITDVAVVAGRHGDEIVPVAVVITDDSPAEAPRLLAEANEVLEKAGHPRIAVLDEGQVVELWVERTRHRTIVGNIYKGRVTKVLPGMQSAFVDLGLERDAFLYVSDVIEELEEFHERLPAQETLDLGFGVVEKGTTAAMRFEVRGLVNGEPRVYGDEQVVK